MCVGLGAVPSARRDREGHSPGGEGEEGVPGKGRGISEGDCADPHLGLRLVLAPAVRGEAFPDPG